MVFPLILSGRKRAPLVPGAFLNWDASGWELDSAGSSVLSLTDSLQGAKMTATGSVTRSSLSGYPAWQHNTSYLQGNIPGGLRAFPTGSLLMVIAPVSYPSQGFCAIGSGSNPSASIFEYSGYGYIVGRQDSFFAHDCREVNAYGAGPFVWMFTWDNTPASGSRKADLWSNGVLLSSTSVTTVDTQSADFATVGRYPGGGVSDSISKVACFQVGTSYVPNGNEVSRQFMGYWNIP